MKRDWSKTDYVMYKRALKAEVLEYMRNEDIGIEEAYYHFESLSRRPSLGTMKAVRKEVDRVAKIERMMNNEE